MTSLTKHSRLSRYPRHGPHRKHLSQQSQSLSYFTSGGLPPISSSWRQAPWDPRPEFLLSKWTLAVIVWREAESVAYNCCWASSTVASSSYRMGRVENTASQLLHCCVLRICCPQSGVFAEQFRSNGSLLASQFLPGANMPRYSGVTLSISCFPPRTEYRTDTLRHLLYTAHCTLIQEQRNYLQHTSTLRMTTDRTSRKLTTNIKKE
jgi:hypothetical protein